MNIKMTYQEFFSRYTYDRRADKVADGKLGAIYKAIDTQTGAAVCLRILIAEDESRCMDLINEAEYVAKLPDDDLFVHYRDVNLFQEATGYVSCAVMPYYPLGTLNRVLDEWKLDDDEKRSLADAIVNAGNMLRDNGFEVPRFNANHIFISETDGKLMPHLFDLAGADTDDGTFVEDVYKVLPCSESTEEESGVSIDSVEEDESEESSSRKWKLLGGIVATWVAIIALICFVHCKRNAGVEVQPTAPADSVERPLYPADEFAKEEAARADSIAKAKADSIEAYKADSAAYMKKVAAERNARAKEREEAVRKDAESEASSVAADVPPTPVHPSEAPEAPAAAED